MVRKARYIPEERPKGNVHEELSLLFGTQNEAPDSDEYLQICCCGTHGTGKTTLMWEVFKWLKKEVRIPVVPCAESSRDPLLDVHSEDYERLLIQKRASMFHHFGHFVADRSLLDPLAYQKVTRGHINKELMEFAFKFTNQCLFYVPIKFDLVGDGVRPVGEEYQRNVQIVLEKVLKRWGGKYYTVTRVDLVERLEFVKHVILDREGWKDKFKL